MSLTTLSQEQMRRDIAELLEEDIAAVVAGENLVDLGLDSIRIMALAERWSRPGIRVAFDDLAEVPELTHWWETVSRLQAAAVDR